MSCRRERPGLRGRFGIGELLAEKDYKTHRFELPEEVKIRIADRWGGHAGWWEYRGHDR